MTYSSTTYRLLIAAPNDVPSTDIATVIQTINRWNAIYGRQFGAVIVPIQWALHSAAEHGGRPQGSLNEQLVADADILVALFWHRLGSPTGGAESGTAEEIETAQTQGAYVGILRCTRAFPPDVDTGQLEKVCAFYADTEAKSLMLDYSGEGELARHVDAILNRSVTREHVRAEAAAEVPSARAEVWPRIERTERVDSDSKGRVRTRTRWQLVLANTGTEPANRVQHRLEVEAEGDDLPMEMSEDRELEALAPGGEATYSLAVVMGTAPQVRCVVTWEDSAGEHENRASLRFL